MWLERTRGFFAPDSPHSPLFPDWRHSRAVSQSTSAVTCADRCPGSICLFVWTPAPLSLVANTTTTTITTQRGGFAVDPAIPEKRGLPIVSAARPATLFISLYTIQEKTHGKVKGTEPDLAKPHGLGMQISTTTQLAANTTPCTWLRLPR